jgi:hypothetical protein
MWDAAEIVICGAAECNIGIIAASIPCLDLFSNAFETTEIRQSLRLLHDSHLGEHMIALSTKPTS